MKKESGAYIDETTVGLYHGLFSGFSEDEIRACFSLPLRINKIITDEKNKTNSTEK